MSFRKNRAVNNPSITRQQRPCRKGYIWNGSQCVPAFQPAGDDYDVLQDIIDVNNLPQTMDEFLEYNGGTIAWENDRIVKLDLSCYMWFDGACSRCYSPQCDLPYLTELPDSLGNLTELRELQLSYNPQIIELPNSICGLKHLELIRFNNYVDPYTDGLLYFPECLGQLTNLWSLHFSGNQVEALDFDICNLTNLEEFYCTNCNLTGDIPECIYELTQDWEYGTFQISSNKLWCDYYNPETGCEQGCAPQWYCDATYPNGPMLPVGSGCSSGYTNQRCDEGFIQKGRRTTTGQQSTLWREQEEIKTYMSGTTAVNKNKQLLRSQNNPKGKAGK